MITKSTPAGKLVYPWASAPWENKARTASVNTGAQTIQYGSGPKYLDGRCNWKPCRHDFAKHASACPDKAVITSSRSAAYPNKLVDIWPQLPDSPYFLSLNGYSQPDPRTVYEGIWDQLDLNCHDSVLLYSGILQAVPLLGGCFKFISLMNNLGRRISRGLRNQPFTTVVQAAISADFVSRFVVKPTIDDAMKFMDAHNYVLRIMNTAYERSGSLPTSYEMQASDEGSKESGYESRTRFETQGYGGARFYGRRRQTSGYATSVSVLASVAYNTAAIDPIKLWATRCGVTRPLDSLWDLIPFSFVIDYFARAGEFISGAGDRLSDQDALRGRIQKFYGAWKTVKCYQYDRITIDRAAPLIASDVLVSAPAGASFGWKSGYFIRSPFNPMSAPTESPNGFFRLDLSPTRIRTLGELFIQRRLR